MRLRSNAPRGHDDYLIGAAFSATANGDFSAMSLIDPVTGARLRPAAWDPDTDPDLFDEVLTPGGTKTLSVSFPAPRGRTADVLVPHFGSFRDVPVR
jgi:hypothetical protein